MRTADGTVERMGNAVVMRKGSLVMLWDARHNAALSSVTIEEDNMRIHVNDALKARFPRLAAVVGAGNKIHANEFVFHVLDGHPVQEGYTVVPINQVRGDVRAANLRLMPGEGKNYRQATHFPVDDALDIGRPYLPYGVTTTSVKGRAGVFEFHVRTAPSTKPKKFTFRADTSRNVFEEKVLPTLRAANPHFEEDDAAYTHLVDSYYTAIEA